MSAASRSLRAVVFALVALAVIGAAACTDDPKPTAAPANVMEIRDATFAAGSANYEGEVGFADGTTGPVQGVAAADPAQGDVVVPIQTTTGPQQAELTWVDANLYVQRVAGAPAAGASGLAGLFARSVTDRPWVRLSTDGIGQTVLSPYDPFTLLNQLNASVEVRPDGSESVDGKSLDRYVAEAQGDGAVLLPGVRRVELLVDRDNRLVVARVIGDQTIEYTLSDYGTDVSVAAPPEDQIVVPVITDNSEDPAGDYEPVAGGTVDGTSWQLMRAPATGDGWCWRLDIPGGANPVAATESDGATCLAALDPAVDEPVQVVADTGSQAPLQGLATVLPGGSQAVLRFVEGPAQTVAVDPGGFLVWVGPKEPMLVLLDVVLPDGSRESCGPGSVSSMDDLDSLAPQDVAALRDQPWLCTAD